MKDERNEAYARLLAMAETTDQGAFREISAFVLAAEQAGEASDREAAHSVLIQAAKTFTQLLSMTFQAVAWNKEVLFEEQAFQASYEKVSEATAGFTTVKEAD